jgi:hypothetical protein
LSPPPLTHADWQLNELCIEIADEWPGWEQAKQCLGEKRKVDGRRWGSSWRPGCQAGSIILVSCLVSCCCWWLLSPRRCEVPYKQAGPIVKKLMRLVFTGVVDGPPSRGNGEPPEPSAPAPCSVACCCCFCISVAALVYEVGGGAPRHACF